MHLNRELSEELFRLFTNLGHAVSAPPTDGGRAIDKLQYALLGTLAREPRRASDLTCQTGLDQSTMSRRLSQLCDAGLAERTPDPSDGRAHLLRVTEAGARAVDEERSRRVRVVTDALTDWTDADRADLVRLLAQLNSTLEPRLGIAQAAKDAQ
ncbi:MAG TPA: MarR family winged helix-turn-helix transcriptional regulator [Arachnia sp.]|jgi:DNA-binding MarR family transcriptional regulator|nr:MarR family winged helix-turn-helix transcriptional regulator [Arachnia sp.]